MVGSDRARRRAHRAPSNDPAAEPGPAWIRRSRMVEELRVLGVGDERVLRAMATVSRERFLPAELAGRAYEASPLPIAAGQTISAPHIVAVMTAALELSGTERVLEIGTGSGYGAAILSRCAGEVVSIEHHPQLAAAAARSLARQGYCTVEVRVGDGARGAPDRAPFDAISLTAMAPDQLPPDLVAQLAPGGRLVGPVGPAAADEGQLLRLWSSGHVDTLMAVRFVPLISGP